MAPTRGHEETTLILVDRRFVRLPSLVLSAASENGAVRARPLGVTPLVVGTAPDCDLVVDDPAVSRRHCLVTLTSRGVLVRDLQSKNGTSIGGTDVLEALLALTSVAKIGGTTLRLRVVGAPSDLPLSPAASFGSVLGGSIAMRALFAQLEQAALAPSPIVLHGEAGTGKELLARAIHARSARREEPFEILEPDGDPFETDAGTLFVDELADLAPEAQASLLRALDSNRRIIGATSFDLQREDSPLRRDLFFRLATLLFRVPPLRERKDDIELLTELFLAEENPPKKLTDLPPGALDMLRGHDWPGNVRELKNTVARMIRFPHLGPATFDLHDEPGRLEDSPLLALPLRDARQRMIERFEAQYLLAKLREHHGNVTKVAAAVGLSRQMVHRLLARYGIGSRDGA